MDTKRVPGCLSGLGGRRSWERPTLAGCRLWKMDKSCWGNGREITSEGGLCALSLWRMPNVLWILELYITRKNKYIIYNSKGTKLKIKKKKEPLTFLLRTDTPNFLFVNSLIWTQNQNNSPHSQISTNPAITGLILLSKQLKRWPHFPKPNFILWLPVLASISQKQKKTVSAVRSIAW